MVERARSTITGEPTKGSPTAKVTLIEVSDYHCPFCRRHMQQTQPQIDSDYINTGKVRYVFVDYPIEQLHPEAFKAHEAANCANDQGKFWEMHAKLFDERRRRRSRHCSSSRRKSARARRRRAEGVRRQPASTRSRCGTASSGWRQLDVNSTPTFLVGVTPAPGQPMRVPRSSRGAVPFAAVQDGHRRPAGAVVTGFSCQSPVSFQQRALLTGQNRLTGNLATVERQPPTAPESTYRTPGSCHPRVSRSSRMR